MKEGNTFFVDFKAIKNHVSIVQILDHYGVTPTLSRSSNGDRLSGACPIHGGTNKTHFRASVSKNCWNCFGGCPGGNILDFVSRKENVSIREAALLIQEWFPRVSEVKEIKSAAMPDYSPKLAREKPKTKPEVTSENFAENKPLEFELKHLDPSHPYLFERGLSEETIATFGLGYCSKGLLKDRIAIPIHNREGQLVAYAGRWPGDPPPNTPKYKFPAGFHKSQELYNIHRALAEPKEAPLVIVEGYFDCMMLWQLGVRRVAALMGCSMSPEQEVLIGQVCDSQSRVVIMLDEDGAGKGNRDDIARRLAPKAFVKVHRFESEGQQPEDLNLNDSKAIHLL